MEAPAGRLLVEIDEPPEQCLVKPVGTIRGWFATRDAEIPEMFHFCVGTERLPHRIVARVDVESVLPDHTILGFEIQYNLFRHLPYVDDSRLTVQLRVLEYDPYLLRFTIRESALAVCVAAASGV